MLPEALLQDLRLQTSGRYISHRRPWLHKNKEHNVHVHVLVEIVFLSCKRTEGFRDLSRSGVSDVFKAEKSHEVLKSHGCQGVESRRNCAVKIIIDRTLNESEKDNANIFILQNLPERAAE